METREMTKIEVLELELLIKQKEIDELGKINTILMDAIEGKILYKEALIMVNNI